MAQVNNFREPEVFRAVTQTTPTQDQRSMEVAMMAVEACANDPYRLRVHSSEDSDDKKSKEPEVFRPVTQTTPTQDQHSMEVAMMAVQAHLNSRCQ